MRREDFLYQYLLIYNEYEKKFDGEDAAKYWKKHNKNYGTTGIIFMVLRNALVHNTLETITRLEKICSLNDVLISLENCYLSAEECLSLMNIFLQNEKVLKDLKNKNFNLIKTNRQNMFKLLQRNDEGIFSTIFYSHKEVSLDLSISTYNQQNIHHEYYKDYCIETEELDDKYLIKFFKLKSGNEYSPFDYDHRISIYFNRNFKTKSLYKDIDEFQYYSFGKNQEYKLSKLDLEKLNIYEIKEKIEPYLNESILKEVVKIIKKSLNDMNNILHIIGFNTNI